MLMVDRQSRDAEREQLETRFLCLEAMVRIYQEFRRGPPQSFCQWKIDNQGLH